MKRATIFIALFLFFTLFLVWIYFNKNDKVYDQSVENKKIILGKDSLYLKLIKSGISSDNFNLLICSWENSDSNNYCYTYDEPIFYRITKDSLVIFCYKKSKVPLFFNSRVPILQKELSNPEMIELMHTYKSKGLELIE